MNVAAVYQSSGGAGSPSGADPNGARFGACDRGGFWDSFGSLEMSFSWVVICSEQTYFNQ
jgi:hypothetical protein